MIGYRVLGLWIERIVSYGWIYRKCYSVSYCIKILVLVGFWFKFKLWDKEKWVLNIIVGWVIGVFIDLNILVILFLKIYCMYWIDVWRMVILIYFIFFLFMGLLL